MAGKIVCSSCGGVIDSSLEKCPFCGTINISGEEIGDRETLQEIAIKCKYCGGNLDLKTKACPYCGRSSGYARNIGLYLYTKARRNSGITIRAAVLAALVIALLGVAFVQSKSYRIYDGIHNMVNYLQRDKHKAVMNEYLENEDFLQFEGYCQKHEISVYRKGFQEYEYIKHPAGAYAEVYYELMGLIFPADYDAEEPVKYESLGDMLDYFYIAVSDKDFYGLTDEETAWTRQNLQNMKKQLESLLVAYCGLTPEEAADLQDMSKSKRVLLIEERMSHAE